MGRRGESGACLASCMQMVLCDESEEDLKAMMGSFVEVYRRRCLKINAGESKGMVLNLKDGLECEVYADGMDWSMCRNLNIWDVF